MSPFELIARLHEARIFHTVTSIREGALLIDAAVPGERWEIEVFEDGHVEIERYRSDGHIVDETALPDLFSLASDTE